MNKVTRIFTTKEGAGRSAAGIMLNYGLYVVMILAMAALAAAEPSFLTFNNIFSVATQSGYVIVASIGAMTTILAKGIDLSVAGVLTLSSILGATLMRDTGIVALGLVAMLLAGVLCGLINGLIVSRLHFPPFIATLAMMNVTTGLSLGLTEGNSVNGLPAGLKAIAWGKLGDTPIPVTLVITLCVFLLGLFVLKKTVFGRRLYAVGGNSRASAVMGINVKNTVCCAYAISGLTAAIGAVLLTSRLNVARYGMAENLQMTAIAAAVIGGASLDGGRGGPVGTLIGALLMALIQNGLNLLKISTFYQLIFTGAIIFAAVVLDGLKRAKEG